jgi:hypothetical protein
MENVAVLYAHLVYLMVVWYILWLFGIFYGYLVYFMVIWYILWLFAKFSCYLVYFLVIWYISLLFGIFFYLVYFMVIWYIFPVLVCCNKKNLATLDYVMDFRVLHFSVAERVGQSVACIEEVFKIYWFDVIIIMDSFMLSVTRGGKTQRPEASF